MKRKGCISFSLALTLAVLGGCSGKPSTEGSQKAAKPLDKIQGKAQVMEESGGAMNSALNAGGSSVYLAQGMRRYRLFLRTAADITQGNEYVAEGVYAQKAIDDLGDPDQGKNGYPLAASCAKVVTMAWKNMAFDDIDAQAGVLRNRVQRYPARPVFLVTRIRPATDEEIKASAEPKKEADDDKIKEVPVAWDKQKAALIEGPAVQPAPLWAPTGGTVQCKVIISPAGKVSDLETGIQLCESVPWPEFRFQPPLQAGHPVKVSTAVEIRFDPRK
jgi:hypothetical protein